MSFLETITIPSLKDLQVRADDRLQQKGLKSSSYVNSVSFDLGESFPQTIHSQDQVRVNGEQSSIKADEP